MTPFIVIGLGFGDEGKGKTVSHLIDAVQTDWTGTKKNVTVVRFSGGQQAGHTVIHNGIKHTFSSYGSGALQGAKTYISEHCTVNLNNIYRERVILKDKGIDYPVLHIHPLAKVTTPFDVYENRNNELVKNHGSCGMGVGATMKRNVDTPYKLHAIDTNHSVIFLNKLREIGNYYYNKWGNDLYNEITSSDYFKSEMNLLLEQITNVKLFDIKNYEQSIKPKTESVIFEGSQGVMLDMDHGIFPNVTYANTTSKNAIEICNRLGVNEVNVAHVTRCYQTRHGHGWMSNQEKVDLINNEEEINVNNEWQKEFKISEFDIELLNHAAEVDRIYWSENFVNLKYLMVTCLDQRPNFKFDPEDIEFSVKYSTILGSYSADNSKIKILKNA